MQVDISGRSNSSRELLTASLYRLSKLVLSPLILARLTREPPLLTLPASRLSLPFGRSLERGGSDMFLPSATAAKIFTMMYLRNSQRVFVSGNLYGGFTIEYSTGVVTSGYGQTGVGA